MINEERLAKMERESRFGSEFVHELIDEIRRLQAELTQIKTVCDDVQERPQQTIQEMIEDIVDEYDLTHDAVNAIHAFAQRAGLE